MTDTQSSDVRWDAAATLAQGVPDEQVGRRRWRGIAVSVGVGIGMALYGFALTLWIFPDGGEGFGNGLDATAAAVQSNLTAVGILLLLGGFFWSLLTGRYVTRWNAITSPLSRPERKTVRKLLAGKVPVAPNRLPLLLAIARQNQRITQGLVPLFAGLMLFFVALTIGSTLPYSQYISIVVGVLFLFACAQVSVVYVTTARFIRAHAAQPSGA